MKSTGAVLATVLAAALGIGMSTGVTFAESSGSLGGAEAVTTLPGSDSGHVLIQNAVGAMVECDYAPENYLHTFTNCHVRDTDPIQHDNEAFRYVDPAPTAAATQPEVPPVNAAATDD